MPRSPRHLFRIVAAALAVATVGTVAVVATLPSGDAATPAETIAGVHVLQQVSSTAELTGHRANLEAALRLPGVTTLAVRSPWNTVDANFAIFDLARQIANATGDQLTVRFMAGRHTPTRIKTACGPEWLLGSAPNTFPKPFDSNGTLNECFRAEYRTYVQRLAVWARANDVHEIHLSHYANQWAEFYWGPEVQAIMGQGAAGQTAMVAATNALADVGMDLSGADLAFELPMSGHGALMRNGPTGAPGIAERVTQHVVSIIGEQSDRFFIQGNGWDTDGIWGAPNATTESNFDYVLGYGALLGVQMIQPQQYNWDLVFNVATAKKATTAEIYLPSFTTGSATAIAQLKAEVAAWQPFVPPVIPPPTTTTMAPTTIPATTTTVAPTRTCQAVWDGVEQETRQALEADCSLVALAATTTTTIVEPTTVPESTTTTEAATTTTSTTTTPAPTTTEPTTMPSTTTTVPPDDPNPPPPAGPYGSASSTRTVVANGETISVAVRTPTGSDAAGRRFPLILVGHGQLGTGTSAVGLHAYLVAQGYVLAGPSMGDQINTTRARAIMAAVLADMATQPSVQANRVGYVGVSMGGNVGYNLMRANLGIDAFLLRMTWSSTPGTTVGALWAQHGDADTTVSMSSGRSAYDGSAVPKVWTQLAGVTHSWNVTGQNATNMNTAAVEWFHRFLYGDTAAMARFDTALDSVTIGTTVRQMS